MSSNEQPTEEPPKKRGGAELSDERLNEIKAAVAANPELFKKLLTPIARYGGNEILPGAVLAALNERDIIYIGDLIKWGKERLPTVEFYKATESGYHNRDVHKIDGIIQEKILTPLSLDFSTPVPFWPKNYDPNDGDTHANVLKSKTGIISALADALPKERGGHDSARPKGRGGVAKAHPPGYIAAVEARDAINRVLRR